MAFSIRFACLAFGFFLHMDGQDGQDNEEKSCASCLSMFQLPFLIELLAWRAGYFFTWMGRMDRILK